MQEENQTPQEGQSEGTPAEEQPSVQQEEVAMPQEQSTESVAESAPAQESQPVAKTDLQKKSVIGMIIIAIITLGIYVPFWFFKQKEKLNSLNSKMKIRKIIILVILVFQIVNIIIILTPFFLTYESLSDISMTFEKFENYQSWISFFTALAVLKASFDTRSIIRDHFNVQLSGGGTFFFTIFYLQHKINQLTASEKE